MPIYDFQCPKCKLIVKDVFTKHWDQKEVCKKCKEIMEKIPSRFFPDVFPNGGIHLEHVSAEGKTFYSKGEMRKYAKKYDLELGAL